MKTTELLAEVVSLPVEDRAMVADYVLKSLNVPSPEIDKLWITIALERLQEVESGKVAAIPAEEAFERIRKRLAA